MLVHRLRGDDIHDPVKVGDFAIVYGFVVYTGLGESPLRLVCGAERPLEYDLRDFEVLDDRLSRFGVAGQRDRGAGNGFVAWGYPDLARDADHWTKLLDREPDSLAVFRRWQEAMDLEFPGPHVGSNGVQLDATWTQCPRCLGAFEGGTGQGVVRCPACNLIMNNPLYIGLDTLPTAPEAG